MQSKKEALMNHDNIRIVRTSSYVRPVNISSYITTASVESDSTDNSWSPHTKAVPRCTELRIRVGLDVRLVVQLHYRDPVDVHS